MSIRATARRTRPYLTRRAEGDARDTKSHTYADDQGGGYTVTVKVTEERYGAPLLDTETFTVTVANKAPRW